MRLSSVVLPAPFGPMRPCTVPRRTARSTASTAKRPPKRRVTPRTSSSHSPCAAALMAQLSGRRGGWRWGALPPAGNHRPKSAKGRARDRDRPEAHHPIVADPSQIPRQADHHRRPEDGACETADASYHHHDENLDRLPKREIVGREIAHLVGVQRSGKPGDKGGDDKALALEQR